MSTQSISKHAFIKSPRRSAQKPARRAKSKTTRPAQIGELLRGWRQRMKLSQSRAANKLGVSKRNLQNWEQGHRMPRGFAFHQLMDKIR